MLRESCDHLRRLSRRYAARAGIAASIGDVLPRLAVATALVASACLAWASSISLHAIGITAMWLRYPLCLAVAYASFVAALGIFASRLARQLARRQDAIRRSSLRHQIRTDPADNSWFDEVVRSAADNSDGCGLRQGDVRAVPAYVIVLLAMSVVLVCIYFISIAPALLAQLVVEGGLVAWLYHPPGRQSGWLSIAVEETGLSALVLAVVTVACGIVLQIYVPRATSFADVWQQLSRH